MTLAVLRSQARLKSGVSVNDYSNANLDTQLNYAYALICYYLASMGEDYFEEQNTTFNLVANSGLYSWPTDAIMIKQVRLAYSTPSSASDYKVASSYDPSDVHNVSSDEENVSSANPIVDITNNFIRIRPKPTSAVTNGGKVWYIAMPSALAATADTPVIPLGYHDKIAAYGAREMAGKYNKWDKWKVLNAEWAGLIAPWEEALKERDMGRVLRFKSPLEVPAMGNSTPVRELEN